MLPTLFTATTARHITRQIIFAGVDPNEVNEDGDSPLHVALKRAAPLAVVAELTRLGAQVNAVNRQRQSVLFLGVLHYDIAVLRHLIKQGAEVIGPKGLPTPLHATVFNDYFDKLDCLLEAGADVNQPGPRLATPLFVARSGAMAARLLQAGANPHLRDRDGRNAAEYLREKGQITAMDAVLGKPSHRPILKVVGGGYV